MKHWLSNLAVAPLAGIALLVAGPPANGQEDVRVIDLTPRFVEFHDSAVAEGAGEARRWELWKDLYDFAALPPVPRRDSLARDMLATAWPRYPAVMHRIRAGAGGLDPAPDSVLAAVARRLEAEPPEALDLVVFVGDTRSGGYFAAEADRAIVALAVEESPEDRTRTLVHEFTHAVHHELAELSPGWERTVARVVLEEGLAVRMEAAVLPGSSSADYLEHRPGWLAEARAQHAAVLAGLRPHLADDAAEQVERFTLGQGTTGLEREAYYAGWVVVGRLLERGATLAALARIPEDRIPEVVAEVVTELLAEDPAGEGPAGEAED